MAIVETFQKVVFPLKLMSLDQQTVHTRKCRTRQHLNQLVC